MYRSLIAGLGLLALTATSTFAATAPVATTAPSKPSVTSVAPAAHTLSAKPSGKMHRVARSHTAKPSNKPAKTAG